MPKLHIHLILIVLTTLLLTACSMPSKPGEPAHSDMPMNTPATGTPTSMEGMSMGNSDLPFDELFIDSMIMHHQGAITMARVAQTKAEHAELKTLANDIVAAQTAEMKQMQAWRTAWYPSAPISKGLAMNMGTMQIADDPNKPFDLRFIEAMIPHHQGAIEMAKAAQTKAKHPELKTLAAAIIKAQETEITQMKTWQATWFK